MSESLINKSDRIQIVDTKLESIGKRLNIIIGQGVLIFLLCIIDIFSSETQSLLPEILGLEPSQYLQLLPVGIFYSFIQFGFLSLRGLYLISERDILIVELSASESKVELTRIKNIFRLVSFLEIFYKTLIYDGVTTKVEQEEKKFMYKAFSLMSIIFINFGNNAFLIYYLVKYLDLKDSIDYTNYPLIIFCAIAIIVTILAYYDYFFKVKRLRKKTTVSIEKLI